MVVETSISGYVPSSGRDEATLRVIRISPTCSGCGTGFANSVPPPLNQRKASPVEVIP